MTPTAAVVEALRRHPGGDRTAVAKHTTRWYGYMDDARLAGHDDWDSIRRIRAASTDSRCRAISGWSSRTSEGARLGLRLIVRP